MLNVNTLIAFMLNVVMLSVAMLNVVKLIVIMLNAVMMNVVKLIVIMLIVIMLKVIMLSIVGPFTGIPTSGLGCLNPQTDKQFRLLIPSAEKMFIKLF
jgi:hypothetical protein